MLVDTGWEPATSPTPALAQTQLASVMGVSPLILILGMLVGLVAFGLIFLLLQLLSPARRQFYSALHVFLASTIGLARHRRDPPRAAELRRTMATAIQDLRSAAFDEPSALDLAYADAMREADARERPLREARARQEREAGRQRAAARTAAWLRRAELQAAAERAALAHVQYTEEAPVEVAAPPGTPLSQVVAENLARLEAQETAADVDLREEQTRTEIDLRRARDAVQTPGRQSRARVLDDPPPDPPPSGVVPPADPSGGGGPVITRWPVSPHMALGAPLVSATRVVHATQGRIARATVALTAMRDEAAASERRQAMISAADQVVLASLLPVSLVIRLVMRGDALPAAGAGVVSVVWGLLGLAWARRLLRRSSAPAGDLADDHTLRAARAAEQFVLRLAAGIGPAASWRRAAMNNHLSLASPLPAINLEEALVVAAQSFRARAVNRNRAAQRRRILLGAPLVLCLLPACFVVVLV